MPVTHAFTSGISDGADSSLVRPSNWNAGHLVSLAKRSVSANFSYATTDELVEVTTGSGGVVGTLPDAAANSGHAYITKKVDTGAGAFSFATTSSQTIDDALATSFSLLVKGQTITVVSNGSNWNIVGNCPIVRGDTSFTTASLAPNATDTGTVALGKTFVLHQVASGNLARIRFYSTAAGRTADLARKSNQSPTANCAMIWEGVLDSSALLTFITLPTTHGKNMDSPVSSTVYWAVTNLTTSTRTITVTCTRSILEV